MKYKELEFIFCCVIFLPYSSISSHLSSQIVYASFSQPKIQLRTKNKILYDLLKVSVIFWGLLLQFHVRNSLVLDYPETKRANAYTNESPARDGTIARSFRSFLRLNDTSVSGARWKLARPDIIADIVKLIPSEIIPVRAQTPRFKAPSRWYSDPRGTAWNVSLFFSRS